MIELIAVKLASNLLDWTIKRYPFFSYNITVIDFFCWLFSEITASAC